MAPSKRAHRDLSIDSHIFFCHKMVPGPSSTRTYYGRTYYGRTYYERTYYEIIYFATFLINKSLILCINAVDLPESRLARFFTTFWAAQGEFLTRYNLCSCCIRYCRGSHVTNVLVLTWPSLTKAHKNARHVPACILTWPVLAVINAIAV